MTHSTEAPSERRRIESESMFTAGEKVMWIEHRPGDIILTRDELREALAQAIGFGSVEFCGVTEEMIKYIDEECDRLSGASK